MLLLTVRTVTRKYVYEVLFGLHSIVYPYITSHPTEVIKSFNDTQQFECTAAGYPLPKIYWQKKLNGQDYHFVSEVLLMAADVSDHEISSTLTLNKSISSAGDYRCITTSSVTNPQSYPENRPNVSNPVQYIGEIIRNT